MKRYYLLICLLTTLFIGCKDNFEVDTTIVSLNVTAVNSSQAEMQVLAMNTKGDFSIATVSNYGVYLSDTNKQPSEQNIVVSKEHDKSINSWDYSNDDLFLTVTGLAANTTYYIRPFVSNKYGTITGDVITITTSGTATVTTEAATEITTTTAQIHADVQLDGKNVHLEKRGFVISTYNNPTINDANTTRWEEAGQAGSYGLKMTGLTGGTRYYFRGYIIVENEVLYGKVLNFTTLKPDDKITMSLNNVTDITTSGANVSGYISIGKDIVGQMIECGFLCSVNANPTLINYDSWWFFNSSTDSNINTWSGKVNLTGKFSNLAQNTTYYYRMYYILGDNIYYDSSIKSFTTSGTSQSYYTVSQIMNIYSTIGLAPGEATTDTYTVRGYVTLWNSGYPDYQNAECWIDDSANGSTSRLKCFRLTGVLDSDKRTLNVGDYIEAQNCHLLNYNGIAELKDGTFTVINAASTSLGSKVSDFVGTYSASVYNVDLQKYESWDNVKIFTYNDSETNSEWIAVSGLNAGYDYAMGEFDATNKALKLYGNYAFSDATYTVEGKGDTAFISVFYPIFINKTNVSSLHLMVDGDGYGGAGEAWLQFNSSGNLILGAAATSDKDGYYANGMKYIRYYAATDKFSVYEYSYVEVTLTKTSSSVSAPKRNISPKRWHAPMLLPQKDKKRGNP